MDFVRSRLALIGLLVAWPAAQLVGCAVKDREYGPASEGGANDGTTGGTGGAKGGTSGKGGAGGKSSGGSSGMGATGGTDGLAGDGSDMAGATGTGGSSMGTGGSSTGTGGSTSSGGTGTNRGGKGGTTSAGGTTSGSSGEAGASGEAGVNATGGTNATGGMTGSGGVSATGGSSGMAGTGGTGSGCVAGTNCLTLQSEFPAKNGAASASDVSYTFAAHSSPGTFQCRNTHGTTPSGTFGACGATTGNTVLPFTTTFAQDSTKDGLWTTEVRLQFSDGTYSAIYQRTVYVHHTLYGVGRCPATTSDQAYATYAKTYLEDAGAITETNVKSPFIQVPFTPPPDGVYYVTSADGTVNWMSLRRNFGFSTDGHYMVMTRNYTSSNAGGMGCAAAGLRTHTSRGSWSTGHTQYQFCTALVFNKKGAGLCLGYVSGAVTIAPAHVRGDYGAQIPSPPYSQSADNFAWRKMTAHIEGGASTNFFPKCDVSGCTTGTYLPDKSYFPYFSN
ncbi:MAG TPA: hypothetical protein VMI54_22660 [Polyangiaceae bacterium]|nr:hypothetical protein [Polyangiaceae bacterium]